MIEVTAATRIIPLLFVALLVGCAPSSTQRSREYSTPLAWEALEPESGSPLYLLGSIHIGTPNMAPLHPAITAAYARSSELVVEVDLRNPGDRMAAIYADRANLRGDEHLRDRVSPDTWERLARYLDERDVDPAPLLRLKPWAVMLRLAGMQFETSGYPVEHGVDRRFIDDAGQRTIIALESYELQLDLYDGFSNEVQEMMLRDFLEPEDPYQTGALVDAWQRGDERAFMNLLFPPADHWEPYRKRFFYDRNENMARRLGELARDGRSRFVVVGVGHMVGPRGIPALLETQGFQVRRLVAANP